MAKMYHREKSIQLKSSASALYNNLSVLRLAARSLTHFSVVHANVVNLVSASWDGLNYSHRQLQSKEGNVATSSSLIMQAAWCVLPSRDLLVVASQKGIQMYESDGSIMVYWHALDTPETPTAKAIFARGIAAVRDKYICVGVSSGAVLMFDVPSKGSNITLSEVLEEHTEAVTDMASECSGSTEYIADLVSADDSGLLCVWKSGGDFQLLSKIPGFEEEVFGLLQKPGEHHFLYFIIRGESVTAQRLLQWSKDVIITRRQIRTVRRMWKMMEPKPVSTVTAAV